MRDGGETRTDSSDSAAPGDDIAEEGIRYLQAINFKESAERGAAQLVAAE